MVNSASFGIHATSMAVKHVKEVFSIVSISLGFSGPAVYQTMQMTKKQKRLLTTSLIASSPISRTSFSLNMIIRTIVGEVRLQVSKKEVEKR